MPKGQPQLSAVARQRSLRNKATSSIVQPNTSINIQKDAKDEVAEESLHEDNTAHNDLIEFHDATPSKNQFSGLVTSGNVNFTSARRIERVNDTDVKVRIERGQKCVLLGICSLWVKDGTISIYGALLSASTDTYRIYAPVTHALPAIEAITKFAEFQLNSIFDGLQELPSIGYPQPWQPSGTSGISTQTFYILDYSFNHDTKLSSRIKELNTEQWRQTLNNLSKTQNSTTSGHVINGSNSECPETAALLIHGQRCSGLSTFFLCLTNHFLSLQKPKGGLMYPRGVLVLDLDYNNPEFSPPGTLALVRVKRPVFGPPFTHMIQSGLEANTVIKVHFVAEVAKHKVTDWILECLLDLLRVVKTQRTIQSDLPVLVKASNWLDTGDTKTVQSIWSELDLSAVVVVGVNTSSTGPKWWEILAKQQNCTMYELWNDTPIQENNKTREHDIQMQSFFHARVDQFQHLYWEHVPLLQDVCARQNVAYCGEAAVFKAIVILAEGVVMEMTRDALEKNIVTIVAVDCNEFEKTSSRGLIGTTPEDLPRMLITPGSDMPITARSSRFLGFAYVHVVNPEFGILQIHSTLDVQDWKSKYQTTEVLYLVVHRGLPDGRYQPQWIKRELNDSDTGGDNQETDILVAESPARQEDSQT